MTVADPEGGQIRPWPPIEIGNGVWPPLRDRKSNGSIVILLKSKEFGPPVSMSATDLPPPMEKDHNKSRKRSMTKKSHQKILGDRWKFFGKCRHLFGKRLKRSFKNFGTNLPLPPVSEVLDP